MGCKKNLRLLDLLGYDVSKKYFGPQMVVTNGDESQGRIRKASLENKQEVCNGHPKKIAPNPKHKSTLEKHSKIGR